MCVCVCVQGVCVCKVCVAGNCHSADTAVNVLDGAHGHVHIFAVCTRDCVVGAGHPTEGEAGLWGQLSQLWDRGTQGCMFSRRTGWGLPRDQSPSSRNFSHVWRLPLALETAGESGAGCSQRARGPLAPGQMLPRADLSLPCAGARPTWEHRPWPRQTRGAEDRLSGGVWALCSPRLGAGHL